MRKVTYQDLEATKMDQRRTLATEGKGLKAFTKNQGKTRMKNQGKIYSSIKRSRGTPK